MTKDEIDEIENLVNDLCSCIDRQTDTKTIWILKRAGQKVIELAEKIVNLEEKLSDKR